MFFTDEKKELIKKIGLKRLGLSYPKGYKCHHFVYDIYNEAEVSFVFIDSPRLSFSEIWEDKSVFTPLFLRRKKTLVSNRITHIGIIFPENNILHYSRWMEEERIYKVHLSSFENVFKVYDFVEPLSQQ